MPSQLIGLFAAFLGVQVMYGLLFCVQCILNLDMRYVWQIDWACIVL